MVGVPVAIRRLGWYNELKLENRRRVTKEPDKQEWAAVVCDHRFFEMIKRKAKQELPWQE